MDQRVNAQVNLLTMPHSPLYALDHFAFPLALFPHCLNTKACGQLLDFANVLDKKLYITVFKIFIYLIITQFENLFFFKILLYD